MEYGIGELSKIAGISTRTLRHYDSIGLLKPARVGASGYRFYGGREVELLQQILFYRERGFGLSEISDILYREDFDLDAALEEHLRVLEDQRRRTEALIASVKRTIASRKGETYMSDREKFEAFKKRIVEEKERVYGAESRAKYGDEEVDETNRRLLDMTEEEYERFQTLGQEILKRLEEAVASGEKPEGRAGQRLVLLHKEWLGMTWRSYTAAAHRALAASYTADARFEAYYDRKVKGCAAFLEEAVRYWTQQERWEETPFARARQS